MLASLFIFLSPCSLISRHQELSIFLMSSTQSWATSSSLAPVYRAISGIQYRFGLCGFGFTNPLVPKILVRSSSVKGSRLSAALVLVLTDRPSKGLFEQYPLFLAHLKRALTPWIRMLMLFVESVSEGFSATISLMRSPFDIQPFFYSLTAIEAVLPCSF